MNTTPSPVKILDSLRLHSLSVKHPHTPHKVGVRGIPSFMRGRTYCITQKTQAAHAHFGKVLSE